MKILACDICKAPLAQKSKRLSIPVVFLSVPLNRSPLFYTEDDIHGSVEINFRLSRRGTWSLDLCNKHAIEYLQHAIAELEKEESAT